MELISNDDGDGNVLWVWIEVMLSFWPIDPPVVWHVGYHRVFSDWHIATVVLPDETQ